MRPSDLTPAQQRVLCGLADRNEAARDRGSVPDNTRMATLRVLIHSKLVREKVTKVPVSELGRRRGAVSATLHRFYITPKGVVLAKAIEFRI